MSIAVLGAGAFGSALAITWAQAGTAVTLWGRDEEAMAKAQTTRHMLRLPNATLPDGITCTGDLNQVSAAKIIAIALPAQKLRGFLTEQANILQDKTLIACCKGIDLTSMTGPVSTVQDVVPGATAAMLTGPSFAADIAKGLPTALTLACSDGEAGADLQTILTTPTLRLYRTTDTVGAELGGALKNVMAIACGIAMGAGLGDSARAALMTRGFTEMALLAERLGGYAETLHGLSGFGDLVLTCTSPQSRNYQYGLALGSGDSFAGDTTVEGVATAQAVFSLAQTLNIDMPISKSVAAVINGDTTVNETLSALMARPLKEE